MKISKIINFFILPLVIFCSLGVAQNNLDDNTVVIDNALNDSSLNENIEQINIEKEVAGAKLDLEKITSAIAVLESNIEATSKSLEVMTSKFDLTEKNIKSKTINLDKQYINKNTKNEVEILLDKLKIYLEDESNTLKTVAIDKEIASSIAEYYQGVISKYENTLVKEKLTQTQLNALNNIVNKAKIIKKRLVNREKISKLNIGKAKQQSTLIEKFLTSIQVALQNKANEQAEEKARSKEIKLVTKQKDYLNRAKEIQHIIKNKKTILSPIRMRDLKEELTYNEEMAWIIGVDINFKTEFYSSDISTAQNIDLVNKKDAEEVQDIIESVQEQLETLKQNKKQLIKRQNIYKKRLNIRQNKFNLESVFKEKISNISLEVIDLEKLVSDLQPIVEEKEIKKLYSLSELYNFKNAKKALKEFVKTPALIIGQVSSSFKNLYKSIKKKPIISLSGGFFAVLLLLVANKLFAHFLLKAKKKKSRRKSLRKLIKLAELFNRKTPILAIVLFIFSTAFLSKLGTESRFIIFIILIPILAVSFLKGFIYLDFKSQIIDKFHFKRFKIALFIFSLAMVLFFVAKLSHLLGFSVLFYEKIFLISSIYFLFSGKSIVRQYINNRDDTTQLKFKTIKASAYTAFWFLLLPIFIGLLGFRNLSWLLLSYVSGISITLVLLFYTLSGVNDLRKFLKLYCVKKFKHGAFIAQDIISPLTIILKILSVGFWLSILFNLFNWSRESYLFAKIISISQYTIVSLNNNKITAYNILVLILLIYLIFKIAKWFRSISYRWIYSRIDDLGVRTSLSIFTQYILIMIGVLFALNLLGFDLTSLTVFAGALGVGVGLGLQDIAKNFISGILLLIERPLKSSDTVTIDKLEGTVKRIGMRAITLETFDQEEVIIPNSRVISNSFTNWTHTTSILRTVLYIGADYSCEPNKVITVVDSILEKHQDILADPGHKVLLWEYGDSSINYRFQYHINIDESSILDVRDDILQSIWKEFKDNDINIPFPQRVLTINNIREDSEMKSPSPSGNFFDTQTN